jgi:hypothetical protein
MGMSLHIHVLKDGYTQSVIFINLLLIKFIYIYIPSTEYHKLIYKR